MKSQIVIFVILMLIIICVTKIDMLEKAFEKIPDKTNLILYLDQGWQYQMKQY